MNYDRGYIFVNITNINRIEKSISHIDTLQGSEYVFKLTLHDHYALAIRAFIYVASYQYAYRMIDRGH